MSQIKYSDVKLRIEGPLRVRILADVQVSHPCLYIVYFVLDMNMFTPKNIELVHMYISTPSSQPRWSQPLFTPPSAPFIVSNKIFLRSWKIHRRTSKNTNHIRFRLYVLLKMFSFFIIFVPILQSNIEGYREGSNSIPV